MQKAPYKTKQQDLLLSYLKEMQGRHFTAEEIHHHFEEKKLSIGIATIYRQLEKLVLEGKLQKYVIDEHSAACFEYIGSDCETFPNGQHFHLKCEICGKLIHLECEELSEISTHLQKEHDFFLNPFRTVFYGKCSECQKSEKAKDSAKNAENKKSS